MAKAATGRMPWSASRPLGWISLVAALALSACQPRGQASSAAVAASVGAAHQSASKADNRGDHAAPVVPAPGTPGPVSIGFAQDMSVHHEQALAMAGLARANGSPAIQAVGEGILRQQLRELGYLQGWLLLWAMPAASAEDGMPWMREAYRRSAERDADVERFIERCVAGQPMPGLATQDELDALSRLRGRAFDARFIALMVRHHEAALVMARFAFAHAELEPVRQFAAAMGAEQRQEIAWLMRLQPR